MGWSPYIATFGAERPAFLSPIEQPGDRAMGIARSLGWMQAVVTVHADTFEITLTMDAPSAEAAMHHMRGSLKSAFHTAGIPAVGTWPLTLLSVRPSEGRGHVVSTEPTVRPATP